MLAELTELLSVVPVDSEREAYESAVVHENVLGKSTDATRRQTIQRLSELYGLDPSIAVFRALRRLWAMDASGRALLALLCSLARDPLLRASAAAVVRLPVGAELVRSTALDQLRGAVGDRLNPAILDKVARNTASSWTQSGHLTGRVRKIRQRVNPTPLVVAFALWLGHLEGRAGSDLFKTLWASVLDRSESTLTDLTLQAKRLGLLDARIGGDVVELNVRRIDPRAEAR